MDDAEQANVKSLVHQIATDMVEGSAAIQKLMATVAKLRGYSDLEVVVAQNWLTASRIIKKAGIHTKYWENFINALKIKYGDSEKTTKPDKDIILFENCCKELESLAHQIATHMVEGSVAIQKLKATVAKLRDHSDLEAVVAQNWLTASRIIKKAGKDINHWENFINGLKIRCGDSEERATRSDEDIILFLNCCEELLEGRAIEPVKIIENQDLHPRNQLRREEPEEFISIYSNATGRYVKPTGKPEKSNALLSKRKHAPPTFWTGLDREKTDKPKRSGRCFYCWGRNHRYKDCEKWKKTNDY